MSFSNFKNVQQTVIVTYRNGQYNINRQSDGTFLCICKQVPKGHVFGHSDALRRHAKSTDFRVSNTLSKKIVSSKNTTLMALSDQDIPIPSSTQQTTPTASSTQATSMVSSKETIPQKPIEPVEWTEKAIQILVKQPIQYGDEVCHF